MKASQHSLWLSWMLLALFLLGSTVVEVVECSKFKTLYPELVQKAQDKAEHAKSKFVDKYGDLIDKFKDKNPEQEPQTPQQPPIQYHHPPQQPPQQQITPRTLEYLQIGVILSFGAVLAWWQIRQNISSKLSQKFKSSPQITSKEKKPSRVIVDEQSSESDGADNILAWEYTNKSDKAKDEEQVKDTTPKSEEETKIEDPEAIEKAEGDVRGDTAEINKDSTPTEGEKPEEEGWIVVSGVNGDKAKSKEEEKDGPEDKQKHVEKDNELRENGDEEKGKEESDKETELVVSRVPHAKVEFEESQLDFIMPELHHGESLRELTALLKKLNIKPPDENTSLQDKIAIAKMIQKEKRLIIKQRRISSEMVLKRRSHELKVQKADRKVKKELHRQNSIHLQGDEYHKSIILHLSAGIMLAIWLKIMDFNLFTLPLLGTTHSSYFPSSFTLLYQLSNIITVTRIVYAALFLVVAAFLWVFVSKLAPYIVLVFAFLNAWQSIFRAGVYFAALWGFTTFTFYLVAHVRTQLFWRKMMKLSLLYIVNLLVAALIGGMVAHGDPLNPYKLAPYPDVVVNWLLSFLE